MMETPNRIIREQPTRQVQSDKHSLSTEISPQADRYQELAKPFVWGMGLVYKVFDSKLK